jgi:hypothetical protein
LVHTSSRVTAKAGQVAEAMVEGEVVVLQYHARHSPALLQADLRRRIRFLHLVCNPENQYWWF